LNCRFAATPGSRPGAGGPYPGKDWQPLRQTRAERRRSPPAGFRRPLRHGRITNASDN